MIRTKWGWGGAKLQTAVSVLRHRTSGRTVTLVSMIHVGRSQYYDAIAALIAEHERRNAIVLYEGVGSLSEAEVADLSPQERAVYRALAPLHGLYRSLAQSLGLVFQGEALHYERDRWINADLSLRELVRRWAESGAPLLPFGGGVEAEIAPPPGRVGGTAGSLMLLGTPLLLAALGRASRMIPVVRRLRELLVNDRNRAALEAFELTDADRNAIILYGAAHIAGLAEWLRRRGYYGERRTWLTAYVYPFPWEQRLHGLAGGGSSSYPSASPPAPDRDLG
jgi:hypothetical protein